MKFGIHADSGFSSGAFAPVPFCDFLEWQAVVAIESADCELRHRAATDQNRCAGFFPSLSGVPGIDGDFPSCRELMYLLPEIEHEGRSYRFNFIRLSLVCQASEPAWHIDSDAATALTGGNVHPADRLIHRLLLNLSETRERVVTYLDVDVSRIDLIQDGGYIRPAGSEPPLGKAFSVSVPPREGRMVHGIRFVSNRILHSGRDDEDGHFVQPDPPGRSPGAGGAVSDYEDVSVFCRTRATPWPDPTHTPRTPKRAFRSRSSVASVRT